MTDFPLRALILPEPAATEAWRVWRKALDIDALPYESQQLIPALAGRLPEWLVGDACAARFQGIVKMVWSRNQVRLMRAAEVSRTLLQSSVEPAVIAGPLAWSLVTRDEGAIRFIPHLTILILREHLSKAVAALATDGWELSGELPDPAALDWNCHFGLTKGDDTLHLHWRLFPTQPREAKACEWACLENLRTVAWNRHNFQTLSPETDLLHRLTDRAHWDPAPLQADVLMMPFDTVDWGRFRTLALRFAPDAGVRLIGLKREFQLPIPDIAPHSLSGIADRASAGRGRLAQFFRKVSGSGRLLWKS